MKTVIAIWSVIILLVAGMFFYTRNNDVSAAAATCPTGSYDIGISKDGSPICKLEPTGCPYGDSIPLGPECDKQKPREEIQASQQIEMSGDSGLLHSDTVESFGK